MAERDGTLKPAIGESRIRSKPSGLWPGRLALGFLIVLAGGAFGGLVSEASGDWLRALSFLDARTLAIARFTLWQAVLSTALSIIPALLVTRALSRHQFAGRELLLRLFAIPQALPAIVVALGVLALFGRAGFLAEPFSAISGGRWPGVYGLSGILIAHVFFNLPLSVRLFSQSLQSIPDDNWRLASQLGMGSLAQWRLIEWPVLRASLPGVAGLVFMLCVTSFTIVLTLGGGPAATTLEVAIYQALRFDFDPVGAVTLTLLQLGLTIGIVSLLMLLGGRFADSAEISVVNRRYGSPGIGEALLNLAVLAIASAFVLAPMAAVVVAGLKADLARLAGETAVLRATITSLVLAFAAALLATGLSYSLVSTRNRLAKTGHRQHRRTLLERSCDQGAGLILVVPPIVLGAGWFVLARHFGDVFAIAPVMVVTVNAAMAMPFVVRTIRPAYDAAAERHDRLAASLGIIGYSRLSLVVWPVLRQPLMTGFLFAMALSLGDLGVIALFGSDAVQTLPYLLLAKLGAYRTDDAAGLALLLGLLTFALMMVAGRTRDRA